MKLLTESVENRLREFHMKYGHFLSTQPTTNIPEAVKQLRMDLISEEFAELMEAISSNNLVEIADGAADLVYVVVGTCVAYGIPFDRVFSEVHNSNMTKTAIKVADPGQKYGTKTPRGPDYKAPQIDQILRWPNQQTNLETQK